MVTASPDSSPFRKRRFLEQTRDRIVASDPAFSRLRMAGRAMLSLFITAALLGGFHFVIHALPIAGFGLGVVISLIGSLMIRDTSALGQLVSRTFAALGAIVSVAIASVLAPWAVAAYAGFLLVIFVAVYIRRFGTRWFGVGMIGFMAYFMGDFLHPKLTDLGWVAFAAIIAFAATQLVTTILLKDDPERDFRRALVTIDRRIDLILRELRDEASDGHDAVNNRNPLRKHVARLRDAVLMAEGFVPQGEEGALAAQGAASDLAVALFELQLFVERVVGASVTALPDVNVIEAARRNDEAAIERWLSRPDLACSDKGATTQLLVRVLRARAGLGNVLDPAPSKAFAEAPDIAAPAQAGGGEAPTEDHRLIPKSWQLPIQVTVASGIALGCGLLLSPVRWYWAVITAFIVFNNTQSRTDTAIRALQRSAGTLAGLIVGSLVATLFADQRAASIAAILLLFFIGFYFVQASYSVMIFCVTVALALIYGVMGMFTPELLLLRLEETVIGGLAGTGVAFFLFANHTTTAVDAKLEQYLDALAALLDAVRRTVHAQTDHDDLKALSRAVDRAYSDLATTVRPMGGPWKAVTRYGAVREKLLLLTGCAHWGRSLARSLAGEHSTDAEMRKHIDAVIEEIRERIAAARDLGATLFERTNHDDDSELESRRRPWPVGDVETPIFSLEVIAGLLRRAAF